MADEQTAPKQIPYTIASISGVVLSVLGAVGLAAVIATGNATGDAASVGPGWSALAATAAIIGFGTAVLAKLAWFLVDLRHEVREVRGLLASTNLSIPRQPQQPRQQVQGKQTPQAQKTRPNRGQRRRGGRTQDDGQPKESDSAQGVAGTPEWSEGDNRYMEDVAKAVQLGRTLPGPAEPA